ncbi:hypothetical protein B0H63DRAFT_363124, partial [Podospora didyma]
PWEIQAKIFRLWLFKDGHLVHCFSRLDFFQPPADIPDPDEDDNSKRSGLMNVFYWGRRECNITQDCFQPNDVLRLLLVSKRFYFIGVHCFYGLNTFAFSSLGESNRFCQGSGRARIDRVQHLETTLTGNHYLTTPTVEHKGRHVIPFSRRINALSWLLECHRLRTLVVHINESDSSYMRRRYEKLHPMGFKYMVGKTSGQPNSRNLHSLRCVQGMDYVCALRGLCWIRFYDLGKAMRQDDGSRIAVHDWSFVEDITNTTTLRKVQSRREDSKLENLSALFKKKDNEEGEKEDGEVDEEVWMPSADDWKLVKSFYIDDHG